MHSLKKVNSDILLLIILVVRLGLDPFASLSNRHRWQPEDRSILLGETSAYTQTIFHSSYGSHHHIHLKQLEYNEYGEAETLFSRLHYFNSIRSRGESVITCIADFSTVDSIRSNQTNTENDSANETTQSESYSELTTSEEESNDDQLSPEDRDLIEILWKQDVDLGVRRDAYDSRLSLEVEKIKLSEEINKKDVPEQSNLLEEADFVPDPFPGLNYTIDSETGEHLIEELLSSATEEIFENDSDVLRTDLFGENHASIAVTRDSFLPCEDNDSFCDLNEIFSPNQLEQLLPDDLSVDSDYLSQIEDLEKELERYESLENANEGEELATEMYPSMEDCWSDTTTMLPLLSLGATHPPAFSPRPMHLYSSFENSSLHFPIVSQSRPSESFLSMLHSSSLDVPTTDEEYQSISAGIGVGSIGCAVAESITTLTNDSDPVPSHSIINTVYNSEFPEMLYSNHTAAVPHNEMLITDLLLDENLQLVTLQSAASKEKETEEQMDTSNDSVSVPTTQLPTVVDYDSESQNFNEPLYNPPSDAPYYAFKSGYSDPSENAACGDVKVGFRKFDYELPKSSCASTDFIHYNHSYHLPSASEICDSRYKPIVRDKNRSSSDDDAANKDEKKAKELKIPISIDDIINLAIDEYNERLSKYELTEPQLTLIRDIRRRGKNKVAAQNCRKRKMDQINHLQQDLSVLESERMQLKSKHSLLLEQKLLYEDKYSQLYNLILQNTNSVPPNPLRTMPADRNRLSNNPDIMISEDDGDLSRGARAKRKFKK